MRKKSSTYKFKDKRALVVNEQNDSIAALQDFFAPNTIRPAVCASADAFDAAALLPSASVDLIITSPPYWGLRTYGLQHNWEIDREWKSLGHSIEQQPGYEWYRSHGGVLGLEPTPEWFIAHLSEFFQRLQHALKPSGSVWVNLGDTYFARWASIRPEGRQGLGCRERFRRKTPMGGYRQEKK